MNFIVSSRSIAPRLVLSGSSSATRNVTFVERAELALFVPLQTDAGCTIFIAYSTIIDKPIHGEVRTMLREALEKVGTEFPAERFNSFAQNPLAKFMRGDAAEAVGKALGTEFTGLSIKGSVGQGRWAEVPWIACFYPVVTDTATQGYYVVYLFNVEDETVTLSLNQGATAVKNEFKGKAREVLRDRASFMRSRVEDFTRSFDSGPISLGGGSDLPREYEAGHAFGRTYPIKRLPPEDVLIRDLRTICKAYLALEYRGGLEPSIGEPGSTEATNQSSHATVEEIKRYRSHRRIERSGKASKLAKRNRPAVCQVCSFDFSEQYGELGKGYIEAHHLQPLGSLSEGEAVVYRAEDFALLCSNCHRMIHRLDDPSDTGKLRELIESSK